MIAVILKFPSLHRSEKKVQWISQYSIFPTPFIFIHATYFLKNQAATKVPGLLKVMWVGISFILEKIENTFIILIEKLIHKYFLPILNAILHT